MKRILKKSFLNIIFINRKRIRRYVQKCLYELIFLVLEGFKMLLLKAPKIINFQTECCKLQSLVSFSGKNKILRFLENLTILSMLLELKSLTPYKTYLKLMSICKILSFRNSHHIKHQHLVNGYKNQL